MPTILVAGATGYLGRHLVREFHDRGYRVRALTRHSSRLGDARGSVDEPFVGQATKPQTLRGIAEGCDAVISCLGITKQRDGLRYRDVDYQGNVNLLREARQSQIRRFAYVSVLDGPKLERLAIVKAHEDFVRELRASGLPATVIRPNGYFSDMREFLDMARKGRVYLFGSGGFRLNPIHGRDLARACAEAVEADEEERSLGGPTVYTHREIAELAFRVLGKPARVTCIPTFVGRGVASLLRALTPERVHGSAEFILSMLTRDVVGPTYGEESLEAFFRKEARV